MTNWIKCSERMPESINYNEILFVCNKKVLSGWYLAEKQEFECSLGHEYNINQISHWQPLPEPPKD